MGTLLSIVVEALAPIVHGLIESWIDSWRNGNDEAADPDPTDPAGSGA